MLYAQAISMLKKHKLVAILRGVSLESTLPLAHALYEGGIRVLEFTYDHALPDFLEKNRQQVRQVVQAFGDEMLVGCGTVLTEEEVAAGEEAGGRLIISPNTDMHVIQETKKRNMVSMPGALTPTEVVAAYHGGADIVKLFPAGALGLSYIKALRAPLQHIPMSAVGGVKPENVEEFLAAGVCAFGVGSELVRKTDLEANHMAAITARARQYTDAIARWEEMQRCAII